MKTYILTLFVLVSFIANSQSQETNVKSSNTANTNVQFQIFLDSISNATLVKGEKIAYFKANQIGCGGCVKKVETNIGKAEGVRIVKADQISKIVVIAYETSKTDIEKLKEDFKKFKYTVPKFFINEPDVKYVAYDVHANAEKIQKEILSVKGIRDVTVNPETKAVSVAYDSKVLSPERIDKAFKKLDESTAVVF